MSCSRERRHVSQAKGKGTGTCLVVGKPRTSCAMLEAKQTCFTGEGEGKGLGAMPVALGSLDAMDEGSSHV